VSSTIEQSSLPASIEAEQALLSTVVKAPELFEQLNQKIHQDVFFHQGHKLIFKAIEDTLQRGYTLSILSLSNYLENHNLLTEIGGVDYLDQLYHYPLSTDHIQSFIDIIVEYYLRRKLLILAQNLSQQVLAPGDQIARDILDDYQAQLLSMSTDLNDETKPRRADTFLASTLDQIEKSIKEGLPTVPSKFHDLDAITGGFHPGELIILAARPSMGKTALSLNFTLSALSAGKTTLYFSLEMPAEQIIIRVLSMLSKTDQDQLRKGKLQDFHRVSASIEQLKSMPLYIDESSSLTISSIRSRARSVAKQIEATEPGKKLDFIVIDYLQLLRGSSNYENRVLEVSEISRSLKSLSKELKVPIIALSQLNRSLESRNNKKPMMSDLRESGAIEQDADLIMFIYRDEYYNPSSPKKGIAEIIIAKHRNGATGTIELSYLAHQVSFKNKVTEKRTEV
jgi:replicative DNA helicase